MKIVHCANFSDLKYGEFFYSIDRKISNGLIRNDHFVFDFSHRDIARNLNIFKTKKLGARKMNQKLIQCIENIKPDLLLLGHSELITLETIKEIKKLFPEIKIAMWWVDPFVNISHINERLPYLEAFFATTSPEYFSRFFTNKTNFYYLPNICDNSIEAGVSFTKRYFKHDLIFIGRRDKNRNNLIENLIKLKDVKFKLYGDSKDNMIFGEDYLDLLENSKMAINFSRYNDIPLYSSDRIIQLLAQGLLVFSPKIPEFNTLFTEEEVVYFDSFKELNEKINYYNLNDSERIKIAKNGWKRAHKEYNSTKITADIVELIFKGKKFV